MTRRRVDGLLLYTTVCAAVLALGETLVVIMRGKYWPLSLDDYAAAAALLAVSWARPHPLRLPLLAAVWAFATGNLYAMLFTRLDPATGTGERVALLAIATTLAATGLAWTLHRQLGAPRRREAAS